ncbi:hypothetical protein [Aphanothece hegewaldii]|uniref:hypothetical protein n=1 Tax=Aphanothece hegewaldii TaxID=1521625 RepID=UPI0015E63996|nr:hypothetical protein [Aphanothece hegewaldii]
MRSIISKSHHNSSNPDVRLSSSEDEEKQIALLEKEWLDRQMYSQDDRGFYA